MPSGRCWNRSSQRQSGEVASGNIPGRNWSTAFSMSCAAAGVGAYCPTTSRLGKRIQSQRDAATAKRFAQIVRERVSDAFDELVQLSLQSTLLEIRSFARGIQRDYDANKATLRLPWSNGIVEGHVNRLKFIKRQMFGRANFDLLRLRVLA